MSRCQRVLSSHTTAMPQWWNMPQYCGQFPLWMSLSLQWTTVRDRWVLKYRVICFWRNVANANEYCLSCGARSFISYVPVEYSRFGKMYRAVIKYTPERQPIWFFFLFTLEGYIVVQNYFKERLCWRVKKHQNPVVNMDEAAPNIVRESVEAVAETHKNQSILWAPYTQA